MSGRNAAARLEMTAPASAPEAPAPTTDLSAQRIRARRRYQLNVYGLRVLTAALVLGTWELSTRYAPTIVDPFFWGQPSGIWHQLVIWVTDETALGPLWKQVLVTMEETVGGFIVGTITGVVIGVLMGRNRLLADVFSIYIKAANAIPRVVLGALFAISLGLDIRSKVATAAVLVFFVVFFNAFQGVREVDRDLLANARILGASPSQLSRHVILPSALSWILTSLHTSFGFALVGAIVGEYLGARKGIGLMIATAQGTFNANGVFAAMVILAIIAIIAEALIVRLENYLIKWRPNAINYPVTM